MWSKESESMESRDCLRIREIKAADLDPKLINDKQLQAIQDLATRANVSNENFCKLMGIDGISDLLESKFNKVVTSLENKILENEKKGGK
jgi:hypothetical protein